MKYVPLAAELWNRRQC